MQLRDNALKPSTDIAVGNQISKCIPPQILDHARDVGLSLLRSFVDRPSYVLGVTSALPGEGKTTIATALADVMATDFGLHVLLVDSHAERPWSLLHDDGAPSLGFSDWLTNDCSFEDAANRIHEKCTVVPFGTQPISSRDLLQYIVTSGVIARAREQYGLIMLDLPDLVNPAGAALANLCDGVVLIIKSGQTTRDRIQEFLPLLQNVTVHGAVLNHHKSSIPQFLRRAFA